MPRIIRNTLLNYIHKEFKIENGTVIPVTVNSVSHLPATMLTENYRYALVDEKNN